MMDISLAEAKARWSELVERAHFRTATRFADQHAANLRVGGAVHLAICAERGR